MEIIKTGIASYGMSGQVFHAPFIYINPRFELSKIVERSKNLAQKRYPEVEVVRSVEELLCDTEIELVIINTPDDTHYEYTRLALEAGKHVIVEKPFTTTIEKGKELVALAKEKDLMLSVYQNRRWDADFLTVRDIIEKGILGRLVEFESTFSRYRNFIKPNTWKETGEAGGGLTYNLGSHLIDQAIELFGMPEAIYANIATQRTGGMVDDYFLINFIRPKLHPELRITLKAGYLMRIPEARFVLHGTLGSFTKEGTDPQEAALINGEMPGSSDWVVESQDNWGLLHTDIQGAEFYDKYPSKSGNYGLFYENIYEYLRLGKPLLANAENNLRVINVIEAAYESTLKQKIIKL